MKKAPKSFEEALARLQTILTQMQDTPLAESVKLYAEAADLIQYCNVALDKARLQVEEIDARLQPAGKDPLTTED
ncbi:exodeoxyribonuclease VII small subunit [uncultured Gemmiger sp.]|uniref:exodeoxyribonuclease VII small subunit n=1 Tax=uncultured Gemmiger sp. TaxID=1623490 RepID=UPI0025DB2491|nr:exodeoxyribonuclease VII small subunit [uncultured Gemmiger sp.]